MIDSRISREKRCRPIKSYANQIISLEKLQLNDYAKYKVMKMQASIDKNRKQTYDSNNQTQNKFKNNYRQRELGKDCSPSYSPTQRKSIFLNDYDYNNDCLRKENFSLKQKVQTLQNKVKYLKQKNKQLETRNQEQFKSTREDCGEDFNYKEIQDIKKLYQQLLDRHLKLEDKFLQITDKHGNCQKSIAQMKKFVNFQNSEIHNLKQKLRNHQRLIQQNQDDYISLIETLNQKNQEEQNLIQKIKNLQRKQEFKSIVERRQQMKHKAYNRLSQGLIKLKPHRDHSEHKKSIKVKVSEIKFSKVENSDHTEDEQLIEIMKIEQRNREILRGRQSTGNNRLQNKNEQEKKEDSFETSYESEK